MQTKPQDDTISKNIHQYFLAQYAEQGGKLAQAEQHYKILLTTPNHPVQAYKGYAHYLAASNQFATIIDLTPKLDKDFPKDPIVQMAIAMALERTGSQDDAIKRVITLAEYYPGNQEIVFHAAQAYVARKELENAITVIDKFIDNSVQTPNVFMFHFLKAQIYLQMNKKKEALAACEQSKKVNPHFDKAHLLCAMLEEQLGNVENAIKGYSTFLDLVGQDESIQQHVMNLMFQQKMNQEKVTVINISPPCLKKALDLFGQKQPRQALEQLDTCLKEKPNDADARLLKLQILSSLNQWSSIVTSLTTWMLEEPTNQIWFKMLHTLGMQQSQSKDVFNVLHKIEKKHPSATMPVMYLADMYLRSNKIPAALHYLKKLTTLSNDPALKTKALYQMGILYYDQHQFDLMKAVLEQGYSLKQDFAPLCNLLAYYYAGKGKNLSKAQELINIALNKDPDNAHYKDTQAHIWYKRGDYKKAHEYLEPVATITADDNVIAKHIKKLKIKIDNKDHV